MTLENSEPHRIEQGQGTGPLRGIKVVEIAGIGPAPHACTILADLGADVIRVERPGGQLLSGGKHDLLTRGRPSVALNLKDPAAAEAVLLVLARADANVGALLFDLRHGGGVGAVALHPHGERLSPYPQPHLARGPLTGDGGRVPVVEAAHIDDARVRRRSTHEPSRNPRQGCRTPRSQCPPQCRRASSPDRASGPLPYQSPRHRSE